MVQLAHTVTAFGGMHRAAVISGKPAEFTHYHYLFTYLLPYDYPDLTLSGGAGMAVLRTARAAADRPFCRPRR
jgi:hypothetical protein